jgi:hypothetical protein
LASNNDQRHKQFPSEVEIPLDFDGDKSPQVTNTFGTNLDKVSETKEGQETVDDEIEDHEMNVRFL